MIETSYHSDDQAQFELARDEAMLAAIMSSWPARFFRDVFPSLCIVAAGLLFSAYLLAAAARGMGMSAWLIVPMVWAAGLIGFVFGAWWKGRFQ
jgi:hypothetical protein